ncbi:LOW QUALITY PROTEIN: hypothetical protein Cgig2_023777 [Carnegiea gigantea]|uniref:Uncharacterized protein n=1 Tax=Carnegiea gigantea TaxID=171969 RepID=A0A9Q1Q5X9_9CARY|nr:LOW QUALITY PROTEIN: hypothetical protein Cgig2_023777 [Carnegiea gigantea]
MRRGGCHGLIWTALSPLPLAGWQADGGLLPARNKGVLVEKITYLLGDEALPLLFLSALGIGCHLLRSGIPSLEDPQPCLHLLCIKQKGNQMISIGTTNTLGKILKDQKACRGKKEIIRKKLQLREPIQRLPITGLALPPLRALHGLYYLSHKLGDGSRLITLLYIKLEVTGRPSLFSRGLPKGVPHMFILSGTFPQPGSWRMKRKSYFQCFTFDFFSMAVMKPDLLLKQYYPKSPISLGPLWTVYTRLNARAEQGGPLGRGSDCPDHPAGPSGLGSRGTPELVDAPSEDEFLNKLLEEKLEEASHEVELVLVEATSAPVLDEDGVEQGLPCVPSASSLKPNVGGRLGLRHSLNLKISPIINYGDLLRICHLHLWTEDAQGGEVLAAGPRGSARFKTRHRIGNLFGFPTLILLADVHHHPTIDKGQEARELQMAALHMETGQPFRNVPTG